MRSITIGDRVVRCCSREYARGYLEGIVICFEDGYVKVKWVYNNDEDAVITDTFTSREIDRNIKHIEDCKDCKYAFQKLLNGKCVVFKEDLFKDFINK